MVALCWNGEKDSLQYTIIEDIVYSTFLPFYMMFLLHINNLRIKDLPIAELSKKHTNQTISSKFSTLTGLVAATNCFDRASCI